RDRELPVGLRDSSRNPPRPAGPRKVTPQMARRSPFGGILADAIRGLDKTSYAVRSSASDMRILALENAMAVGRLARAGMARFRRERSLSVTCTIALIAGGLLIVTGRLAADYDWKWAGH